VRVVAKVQQGGQAGIGVEIDVAAIAAVTTIRAAARDKFFTAKRQAATPAVTGFNIDFYLINETHDLVILSCDLGVRMVALFG
jgi:hypothetical protein